MRLLAPNIVELTTVDLASSSLRSKALSLQQPIVEPRQNTPSGVRELTHFHPDWAQSPVNPTQQLRIDRARYAKLEDSFRLRLQRAWRRAQSGELSVKEFNRWFSQELHKFQVASFVLGKRAAGDFSNTISPDEKRWLHGQHSTELRYFQDIVKNGRRVMRLDHRLDLYALGSFSIYARGFLETVEKKDPGGKWDWELSDAEHCIDCVRKFRLSQEEGGFTLKRLFEVGLPSEKCVCGHKCKCELSRGNWRVFRTRPTGYNQFHGRMKSNGS